MRAFFLGCCLLALAACGGEHTAETGEGCALSVTREVSFSSAAAPDTITVRSEGPSCAQSVVSFVLRNAEGDALWAFSSLYADIAPGGADVAPEAVETFLASWADITPSRTSGLPDWPADAARLEDASDALIYTTPFGRDAYLELRGRDLPTLCYAATRESSECLVMDPFQQRPAKIVAFGA